MIDLAGLAAALSAGAKFLGALRGLWANERSLSEAELLNQRQEQTAGAARNYASRKTELAERAKRSK